MKCMRFIRGLLARVSVSLRREFNLKASALPACEPWFMKLPTRKTKFKISGKVSFFKTPSKRKNLDSKIRLNITQSKITHLFLDGRNQLLCHGKGYKTQIQSK